ncbi:uncharacterized protein LOC144578228 [Callithrix jacchus]
MQPFSLQQTAREIQVSLSIPVSALGWQLPTLSQSRPQGRDTARGPASPSLEGQGQSEGLCSLQVQHVLCLISSAASSPAAGHRHRRSGTVFLAEARTPGPLCGCAGCQVAALLSAELRADPPSQPLGPRAQARLSAPPFPPQRGLRGAPMRAWSLRQATAAWESWALQFLVQVFPASRLTLFSSPGIPPPHKELCNQHHACHRFASLSSLLGGEPGNPGLWLRSAAPLPCLPCCPVGPGSSFPELIT